MEGNAGRRGRGCQTGKECSADTGGLGRDHSKCTASNMDYSVRISIF